MGTAGTLIGRERELAALTGVLERARSGRGAVALLTGEPGIGKTSLLTAAARAAADLGFEVTWGRAWEAGGAPPHWVWIEALRPLLGDAGGEIMALLEGASSATESFHLCDAVSRFVRRRAERDPLLIVFDDLHAADVASLQIAHFVARQLAASRAAIVGSFRDVEARLVAPVDDALARIGRLGDVISLPRLDRASVDALVAELLETDDSDVVDMVMTATEGNPLFVHELTRLLRARADARPGVPSGVRAVIRDRLALLSPATVALLGAAAVIGRESSVVHAAAVAGVTPGALEEAAAEAIDAALLEWASPGRLRFSHALVAETLADQLAAPARARMHRKAAEALEQLHAGDAAPPVVEIAHHWLLAGAGAADRAVRAAREAAAVSAQRLAFADAARLLERAIAALALADPSDTRTRLELLIDRCDALVRAGDRASAEVVCREAAGLARALDDGVLFARTALALGAELQLGHTDALVKQLLEEAAARLPDGDSELRARVEARLAGARQPAKNVLEPIADALAAIDMARRLGDDETLAYALYAGMAALADYAPAARRIDLNREAAALARALDRPTYELRARTRMLFDLIELADPGGVAEGLEALEALVDRLGVPRYRWMPLAFRSMQAAWEGRWAESDELWQQAGKHAGPTVGPFRFSARELLHIGVRDRDDTHEREVELLDQLIATMPAIEIIYGVAAARSGDVERTREYVGLARELMPFVGQEVHLLQILGEIAWVARDRELAASVTEALSPRLGTMILVTGLGYALQTSADHIAMRMAFVLGKVDEAERHADNALELARRMGARPLIVHALADRAIGAAMRGDRDRAVALAARAAPMAEELGMTNPLARCRAILEGDGAPTPEDAGLSLVREGEYWTVTGFGEVCRIKDSRGMQMISMLVERPDQEIHALELSGARIVDGGDAGAHLDDEARRAYQERLRDLRAELDEAELNNDAGRRERLGAEIDALVAELSRAFGLGGRERRAGAVAERARTNVRRRIVGALDKIAESAPQLGQHLRGAIKTGVYCSYAPADTASSG